MAAKLVQADLGQCSSHLRYPTLDVLIPPPLPLCEVRAGWGEGFTSQFVSLHQATSLAITVCKMRRRIENLLNLSEF